MDVAIPKGDFDTPGPCWIPRVLKDDGVVALYGPGKPLKPSIRCKCGEVCNIALHHVHADGRVTRSFYHVEFREWTENGKTYRHEPGCGWHVLLRLLDYDLGEFPPVP